MESSVLLFRRTHAACQRLRQRYEQAGLYVGRMLKGEVRPPGVRTGYGPLPVPGFRLRPGVELTLPVVRKTLAIIGMVVVAALAASAELPFSAAMTVTRWRTRSAANSGSRPGSLCAQRYSNAVVTLCRGGMARGISRRGRARPRRHVRRRRPRQHRLSPGRLFAADGFIWNGGCHSSLSAIARAITGTKWNELGFDGVAPEVTGRPSYHPSVLLKLYIYGYLNRVQSSRRLEREAGRNVEVMWLRVPTWWQRCILLWLPSAPNRPTCAPLDRAEPSRFAGHIGLCLSCHHMMVGSNRRLLWPIQ